jgi:hypothetical protein
MCRWLYFFAITQLAVIQRLLKNLFWTEDGGYCLDARQYARRARLLLAAIGAASQYTAQYVVIDCVRFMCRIKCAH